MNITPKENPEEFNRFLFEKVGVELFQNKFLLDYLKKVQSGEQRLYDASLLNTNNDSWILILHGKMLLVYGENWKTEQFSEINEIFNLNAYTNYLLTGNSELIYGLIKFYKIENHTIQKERIFYKTKNIKNFDIKNVSIALGKMKNAKELSEMLQNYYHDEYNGQNDKPIEEMFKRIFDLVQTNSIYVLKNSNDEICSFCTIINPDIGILFTKSKFRRNGFGALMMSFCSKILVEENGEVFVTTDKKKLHQTLSVKR
jgi:hypothetical protein